jgi:hypothetical protein
VWLKSAGGDAARPVVPIVIPVRRYTEPMDRGAAHNTGPAIHMFLIDGAIETPIELRG